MDFSQSVSLQRTVGSIILPVLDVREKINLLSSLNEIATSVDNAGKLEISFNILETFMDILSEERGALVFFIKKLANPANLLTFLAN